MIVQDPLQSSRPVKYIYHIDSASKILRALVFCDVRPLNDLLLIAEMKDRQKNVKIRKDRSVKKWGNGKRSGFL